MKMAGFGSVTLWGAAVLCCLTLHVHGYALQRQLDEVQELQALVSDISSRRNRRHSLPSAYTVKRQRQVIRFLNSLNSSGLKRLYLVAVYVNVRTYIVPVLL